MGVTGEMTGQMGGSARRLLAASFALALLVAGPLADLFDRVRLRVNDATPEQRVRKFSATRSPARIARSDPVTRANATLAAV